MCGMTTRNMVFVARVSQRLSIFVVFYYVLKHMQSHRHRHADAIYFDFKEAFDLVDNDMLLRIFAALGFTPIQFFFAY